MFITQTNSYFLFSKGMNIVTTTVQSKATVQNELRKVENMMMFRLP